MKTTFLYFVLLSIAYTAISQETAELHPKNQTINWQGKAAMTSYAPQGTLTLQKGMIILSEDRITSLELVIDMTTLQQENKQLEGHLRDKDFFHVKKYPKASFTLTETATLTDGKTVLTGTMQIKGNTQTEQISLIVWVKDSTIELSFDHTMDRTKYGITYNSPSIVKKLKDNAIADAFKIKGTLKFDR